MATAATEPRSAWPLTRGETAIMSVFLLAACVGVFVTAGTPIPSGNATRDEAVLFLKHLYPDREVVPSRDLPDEHATATFAVVLHLIRSGEPAVARQAIEFATEKQFASAAPYVIGRLDSDDPELERAAQHFLRTIAGGDYGPDAGSWRAWWRNPPLNRFGWSIGWTTLKIFVTGGIALSGLSLILIGLWLSRRNLAALGGVFLGIAYFFAFVDVMIWFVGTPYTCTFGSTRITYYMSPIGLEDSQIGSVGLELLAVAAYVLIPFVLVLVYHGLVRETTVRADGAGIGQAALPAAGERGP